MPNSPAIPLSSAVYGANFRCRPARKIISKLLNRRLFLLVRGDVPAAESFFSLPSGKEGVVQTCRKVASSPESFRCGSSAAGWR